MEGLATTATGLLIDGEWCRSQDECAVVDKFTGEVVRTVVTAAPEDVDRAVAVATSVARRPPEPAERARILAATADLMERHGDELVANYVAETGFTERDARGELARAAAVFRLSGEEAVRIAGEEVPVPNAVGGARLAMTIRAPRGVVAAVCPFNAPLSTVAHKVAPAIAAGNPVVLKPAEITPISALAIIEALRRAGAPAGFAQLVCGPGETVGSALVSDPRVRYITFTGSTDVGLQIKRTSGIARTHLELGANSATIVARDADLQRVADAVSTAGYRKAGQVCTSVQRLLVDRLVVADLVDVLGARVRALVAGDPRAAVTDVGPVISMLDADRAVSWIDEAVASGARVLAGGGRSGGVVTPTLLLDPSPSARLMIDEAFAPIVSIVAVDGVQQAVDIVNSGRYGLQAGIFTRDLDSAYYAARHLEVGGVMINDTSSYHADNMPYGGVKDSGYGVEGPKYAIEDMTHPKIIVFNLSAPMGGPGSSA